MGTWGTGIFEDDVALDVRGAFEDALSEGLDVAGATRKALQELKEELEDADFRPLIYLALAALQSEHGEVQPRILKKALRIIDSREELEKWEREDPTTVADRKRVLEELRRKLVRE